MPDMCVTYAAHFTLCSSSRVCCFRRGKRNYVKHVQGAPAGDFSPFYPLHKVNCILEQILQFGGKLVRATARHSRSFTAASCSFHVLWPALQNIDALFQCDLCFLKNIWEQCPCLLADLWYQFVKVLCSGWIFLVPQGTGNRGEAYMFV